MTLAMVSLAGIPPLAGFFGKFLLLKAVIEQGPRIPAYYCLAFTALAGVVAIIFWNLPIFFIICCIWPNLFSMVFSSVTLTPLPLAMRMRRLALRICGLRRSCGVMPQIIASMCLNSFSCFDRSCALHRFRAAGQHLHDAFQRAELFHLAQLLQKIFQRELALAHLFFHALGVVLVHGFGRVLDEADDVAHAENPRRHALGMKRLELVQLFAHARELDGLAGDGLHAQRRAAARVAVELGEDRTGDVAAPDRNAWRR